MAARHTHTILSMMKDEGHSLVEWVAYHRLIGFDNICVYTNNCADGTDDMLMRLQELGLVRHFLNDVPAGKKPQPNALELATKNAEVMESEWILTMDADEFLNIKCGAGHITDLIAHIPPDASAMAITWRFYGSAGVTDWNPGLVTERYTRAAPDQFKKGWGVKTIFRPYPDIKLGIHRPHIKKAKQDPANAKALFDQVWVNGSGQRMPDEFSLSGWRSTKPTLGYALAELNHYAVKSYEAYLLRRVRGNVNNKEDKYNAAYFALFDRNEIVANATLRHVPALKARMAEILADPVMAELQARALEFHAARVTRLRTTGDYDTWVAELKEASKIPLDQLDEVLFIQHLPKMWQEKVKEMQAQGVPDKDIARMISDTQTAKKGETRTALLAAAGETPPEDLGSKRAERDAISASALSVEPARKSAPPADRDAKKTARRAARAAGIPTKKYAPGEEPPEVRTALAEVALRADSHEVQQALEKLAQANDDPGTAHPLARVENVIAAAPPPHANPFMNTPEARGLGVPALKPHVAALLANRDSDTARPDDPKPPKPAAPKSKAAAIKAR